MVSKGRTDCTNDACGAVVVSLTEGHACTPYRKRKNKTGRVMIPSRDLEEVGRDEHASQNTCSVRLTEILYSSALLCLGEGVPSAVAHMVTLLKLLRKKYCCYNHGAVDSRQYARVATRHTFVFVLGLPDCLLPISAKHCFQPTA